MERSQISIHLIVNNGALWLPWCLQSIKQQTSQDFFLLIIDNGSIDESYEICRRFMADNPGLAVKSRLVVNKQNIGFARAHNQAITWTDSSFVLILNQDVYLQPDYLAKLHQSLINEDRVGAVSGLLFIWDFEPLNFHPSMFSKIKTRQIDSAGLVIKRSRRVINLGQGEKDNRQYSAPQQVWGVPATAALYRRRALMEISPEGKVLDEDFVSYKEDVDLAWRLQLGGFETWLVPAAVAYHDRSLAAGSGVMKELKIRRGRIQELKVYSWTNHLAVLIKNDSWFNLLLDAPWVLSHEIAKAFFLLFTEPVTLVRGKLRLLKLWPRFWRQRRKLKATHKIKHSQLRSWWTKNKSQSKLID